MPDSLPREARRARVLFFVVLALTAFQYVFLIADRRLPLGHETGSLYRLQHSFASGAAQSGSIPLWMPYVNGGTASGWAWFEQGTLFQKLVLLAAPAFAGRSFIPLFHLGMFLEELLLLAGVWLLAGKFVRTAAARFIVAVAALGSSLWIDHAAVNLLAFSSLPLVLYLLHEAFETKSRATLFLAALLMVLQTMGRPPAFAFLLPGAIALYGVGAAVLFGVPVWERLREFPWGPKDAAAYLLLLLVVLAMVVGAYGETDGGGAPMSLLAASGLRNPLEYLDGLLGLSPSLDATVFCGYFTLAFALLAMIHAGAKASARFAAFLLASLLTLGLLTVLSAALLPIPSPSRPPAPGMPLVRLVLIFLAGVGFERLRERAVAAGRVAGGLLLAAAALCGLTLAATMSVDVAGPVSRILTLRLPEAAVSPFVSQSVLFQELAGMSALMAGLAGGALLLWSSGGRRAPFAIALVLLLHPLDVFSWKFRTTWMKTAALSAEQARSQTLDPLPWQPKRSLDRSASERSKKLGPLNPAPPALIRSAYGAESPLDATYWQVDLTDGSDPMGDKLVLKNGPGSIAVTGFEPNSLTVTVDAPQGGVLLYDGAGHPSWTATVNGQPRSLYSGAQKTVPLDQGRSVVEFRFRSPLRSASMGFVGAMSLLCVGWVLAAAGRRLWRLPG